MSEQQQTADAKNHDASTDGAVADDAALEENPSVETASADTSSPADDASAEAVPEEAQEAQASDVETVETTASDESASGESASNESASDEASSQDAAAGDAAAANAAEEAVEAAVEAVEAAAEEADEKAEDGAGMDESKVGDAELVKADDLDDQPAADSDASSEETPAEAPPAIDEPASEAPAAREEPGDEPAAVEEPGDQPAAIEEPTVHAAPTTDAEAADAQATDSQATGAQATDAGDSSEADAAPAADPSADGVDAAKVKVEEIESDEMIRLRAAMDAKLSLDGQVIGWNKGGYHVAIGKIAAFCPVSQIEIGNPRSPKKYLDKSFDFRVIEIQDGGRRVVVSRAAALKAKRAEEAAKVKEQLKQGAILDGRVTSITDFGAFVNLGANVEGLVHVSEISRQRIEHAKEALKVGQKVKVQVLKIEKGGKRISLSMKRLEADPWDGVEERFTSGGEFKGTIARITEFGLFVEVEPGLEGLLHTSRLPLGAKPEEDESLAVGKEIEGWVHDVDRKRRRLSLSMRPVAEGNPWKDVDERFPEGEIVEGKVEKVAKFGVFVELEPGLTGLLPFAVLGGAGVTNPKRQFQPGKPVKVKVLSIDPKRKRISLGTEQSKAEGSERDFKNYVKTQRKSESGLGALAQALSKVKDQLQV